MRLLTLVSGVLLAAAACAPETTNPAAGAGTPRVQPGDTVRLAPATVVSIADSGVQLAFREVTEDSRCPVNVTCVWAGDAAVVLEARLGYSAWKRMTVHTDREPRAADYGPYRFRLVALEPAPVDPHPIAPADYRVRLLVEIR
jgi:hypothetical protein